MLRLQFMECLFCVKSSHDAFVCRRIVGIAHVEDFESIQDAQKRAYCEHRALECAKKLLKERCQFESINQVISVIQQIPV